MKNFVLDKLLFSEKAIRLFILFWALLILFFMVQISRNGHYVPMPNRPGVYFDTRNGDIKAIGIDNIKI